MWRPACCRSAVASRRLGLAAARPACPCPAREPQPSSAARAGSRGLSAALPESHHCRLAAAMAARRRSRPAFARSAASDLPARVRLPRQQRLWMADRWEASAQGQRHLWPLAIPQGSPPAGFQRLPTTGERPLGCFRHRLSPGPVPPGWARFVEQQAWLARSRQLRPVDRRSVPVPRGQDGTLQVCPARWRPRICGRRADRRSPAGRATTIRPHLRRPARERHSTKPREGSGVAEEGSPATVHDPDADRGR